MPTQQVQAVVDAAIPVATKYAMLKRNKIDNPLIAEVEPNGNVTLWESDTSVDMKMELDNLVKACADLVYKKT